MDINTGGHDGIELEEKKKRNPRINRIDPQINYPLHPSRPERPLHLPK